MPTATFGIEIELICGTHTQAQVAQAINAAGVPCSAVGYSHHRTDYWKVVTDGSLGVGGHEVVSPVLTLDRVAEIDKVCYALAGIRANVNRSCGLHVHVGARDLNINSLKRLAALYAESEDVIDLLLPPSRRARNNAYCRTLKDVVPATLAAARDVQGVARAIDGGERYSKINFAAFWRHGTVEFRQHSGTIDPAKIKNWLKLCLSLVTTAVRHQDEWASSSTVRQVTQSPARTDVVNNPYWRSGRRTRTIFNMISHSRGASGAEISAAMNLRSNVDVRWHLNRARERGPCEWEEFRSSSRGTVFRLRLPTGPTSTTRTVQLSATPQFQPITNLDALLDKLQITGVDRTYWVERAAMLSAAHE